jgi:hypothetical protein
VKCAACPNDISHRLAAWETSGRKGPRPKYCGERECDRVRAVKRKYKSRRDHAPVRLHDPYGGESAAHELGIGEISELTAAQAGVTDREDNDLWTGESLSDPGTVIGLLPFEQEDECPDCEAQVAYERGPDGILRCSLCSEIARRKALED